MIACYDLKRCPPTYDAIAFIALAEAERLRRQAPHVRFFILPGDRHGFRNDLLWPQPIEERIKLRENVLVPLFSLLPSATACEVLNTRPPELTEAYGFNQYSVGLPNLLRALAEGQRPLRAVGARRDSKLVTITLREAAHHAKRNSDVDAWIVAALVLRERGYRVVFVRDTQKAGEAIPTFETDAAAATTLNARARLYASAYLNLGISNGPLWMALFMDAPVLMLRPTTNAAGGCYDDRFFKTCGLEKGSQLPNTPLHQRLVWEDDTKGNILVAFNQMEEAIDAGSKSEQPETRGVHDAENLAPQRQEPEQLAGLDAGVSVRGGA